MTKLALWATSAHLTSKESILIYAIGIIAGDLPDIDQFVFTLEHRSDKEKKTESHRFYITHFPLFWLALSALVAGAGWLAGSGFVELSALVLLLGTWSHLAFDTIEYGVPWLAPFSKRLFALANKGYEPEIDAAPGSLKSHWIYVTRHYIRTPTFWAEAAVTLLALWVAFRG